MNRNKKAALEMSVGTIVTIVLLMSMLVLGLVLIRSIFTGSKYNIEILDQKVRGEINKLFVEDQRTVVYLANKEVVLQQGERWGVAWGVKNLKGGTSDASKLNYAIEVSDPNLRKNCGITETQAESYIKQGKEESNIPIAPGETYLTITRIEVPELAPINCIIRYRITTKLDGEAYATDFFDLTIEA